MQGAWVQPPYVGALWTPGWWGFYGGGYYWNAPATGARSIGYYGGINYGFGYFGTGFFGGYWGGGRFFYNRVYCNYGYGFRGAFYESRYNGFGHGFNGRPGGTSFNSHPPSQYHPFGGNNFAHGGSGSTFNGGNFHSSENRGGVAGPGQARGGEFHTGTQPTNGLRPAIAMSLPTMAAATLRAATQRRFGGNNGGGRYGSPAVAPRSYQGGQGSGGFGRSQSYSAPSGGGRTQSFSAPSGGGFHGGSGFSGGGSHGGRR